jgi:siroheme synthase-like protein
MLDLHGRLGVVVGAGKVGVRKAAGLLEAGARVRIIDDRAGELPPELAGAELVRERYGAQLLAGAALVFACTDDRAVNSRVYADARAAGVPVNVVDWPAECDFHAPAVVADGDIVVAIGTGGSAPGLAAWLKGRIAGAMPPRAGEFAAAIEGLRQGLKQTVPDTQRRMEIMRAMVCDDSYQEFLAAGLEALRRRLAALSARCGDAP